MNDKDIIEELLIAYCAGIIDGEGCIYISFRRSRLGRSARHELQVSVSMRDPEALDVFESLWHGTTHIGKNRGKIYRVWRVSDKRAEDILVLMLPYLRVKKTEALLALDFRKLFIHKRPGFGVKHSLSEIEISERQGYKEKLSQLKKRYN